MAIANLVKDDKVSDVATRLAANCQEHPAAFQHLLAQTQLENAKDMNHEVSFSSTLESITNASCAVMHEVIDHSKKTWAHVMKGNAATTECLEAGVEAVVIGAEVATIGKSSLSRLLGKGPAVAAIEDALGVPITHEFARTPEKLAASFPRGLRTFLPTFPFEPGRDECHGRYCQTLVAPHSLGCYLPVPACTT